MKKNQILIILLFIVLFILLKPSTYVATPPSAGPIHYKLYQGPPLPELAPVPKSDKFLTNYRGWMDKFLTVLQASYVTTPEAIAYVKMGANNTYLIKNITNFVIQHNLYFKAKPTTDVCTWARSAIQLLNDMNSDYWNPNGSPITYEPGIRPIRDFFNAYSTNIINIEEKMKQTYSSCGF